MVDTHMANSDNYLRMREILVECGWTVLKHNEDAFRKTGKTPSGVARILENESIVLLIIGERLIGTFLCINRADQRGAPQLTQSHPQIQGKHGDRKIYLFDGEIPFAYLLAGNGLWETNRIKGHKPIQVHSAKGPGEMIQIVEDLAGDVRTFLFPTEIKFIRPPTCKCRSGWVSTKNGGVFDASDVGPCRDCRDLGRYEESQRYW